MKFAIAAEFKNASGVYIIRNSVNKKVYVGSSVKLMRRFRTHLSKLKLGYHDNKYLQNFVKKYGLESLNFELLEVARDGDMLHLAELEQKHISAHNSADRTMGFNLVPTVFPSVKQSEETRAKQSAICRARGISPEQRAKMVAGIKAAGAHNKGTRIFEVVTCKTCGNEFTAEASRKKVFCSRTCFHNREQSDETRAKLAAAHLGKPKSAEATAKRSATMQANRVAKMSKPCEVCRNLFTPKQKGLAGMAARFCSRNCFYNRVVSQETRAKQAAAVGHLHKPEIIAKVYEARKAGKGWVHGPEQVAKRKATIAAKAAEYPTLF